MKLEKGNSSDQYLKRMFNWLTRIGASPKFGRRPIGWYQIHQCEALDFLEKQIQPGSDVRCHKGMIQSRSTGKGWFNVVSASKLFTIADYASRK